MDNNQHLSREEIKDIRFAEPTFIDPLTGLFNQYYLYQFLPEEIKKAKLSNYPLSIFMIDLDGFKKVNDTYGHLCGDGVLKQVAAIIKKSVRQTDMVIRYAGDEFTILLPTVDLKKAEILSNQLIENVDRNVFKGKEGQDIHLTISIGFNIYPYDADQIDKLIDMADKALYLSKQKGKNRASYAKEVTLEAVSSLIAMDSFPCSRFIDRQEEIDRLKQTFDTIVLKSNLLQVVFVSGETGIGKTRLLNELNNYIQDQAVVINYHSSPAHRQDPYYLFAKGISTYIEKIGIDNPSIYTLFSKLPSAELSELSRIIPPVARLVRQPTDLEPKDKEARFLLFKGFLDFLIELNNTSAVLLSFDDIHWADKASLELLRYLSKQEKNKRIFIVCSFLEDKSKQITNDELKDLWEEIRFNDNFTQIKLANFSLEETSHMIEAIFPGIGTEKELCELIYNAAKGNPSFIEEILKSLIENAVIFYQDNRWQIKKAFSSQDIPFSLEEVIKNRLKNLDEETKEAIVQAAVIGEDFSVDLLRKIGNKDEGFMLELLDRAKKMRLVDELETKGKFGFINKNVQNVLYNELNDEQRNRLHYKIGQVIAEEHKDNLYNVAGELAFHFSKAPHEDKIGEYNRLFLEKTTQLFSSYEIVEYLDKLAKEVIVEEEKIAPLLSDKMLKEAMGFIRSLQGAVKIFHLYPPGLMRINAVKETYSILNTIWEKTECFTLGEVEKGLVINGKRISPKEIEQANAEYFLTLMLEHNLKTISFIKGVLQDELDKFIQIFSQPFLEIRGKGGWAEIIKKDDIKGIKIDEVRFIQVAGFTEEFIEKKKIEDIMLMEFLLGKIEQSSIDREAVIHNMDREPKRFAQTIMEAAQEVIKEGKADDEVKAVTNSIEKINSQILDREPQVSDYAKHLARVILELKPALRNKVIRSQFLSRESRQKETVDNIVKAIPDEVIIDMVVGEYREGQKNPLVIKDSLDKILFDESRKKLILPKLETELSKLNMAKEDAAFISGKIKWEDLPLDKRINNLIRLPDEYYKSELGRIKALLEELDSRQNRQELENLLYHLLVKVGQLDYTLRQDLMGIIIDFIKTPFLSDRPETLQVQGRLDGLWKRLKIEVDPKVFANLLDIFRKVIKEFTIKLQTVENITLEIEKPAVKIYCLFIHQLLHLLLQRLKEDKRNPQVCKLIEDFIIDISQKRFLEILVYSFVSSPSRKEFDFKGLFPIIGERLVDTLINLETRKTVGWGDSFQEYIIRKRITNLLQELGEPVLNRLRQILSQTQEDVPPSLIKLVGYLKKEELIDSLLPFIHHKNPLIRQTTILTLGDIGGEKGVEIISRALKEEKNKEIRILAKALLKRLRTQR